jgi:hypothetical protein
MSAKAKGVSKNFFHGMQHILGGHSGLEVRNFVIHGQQSEGANLYWIDQTNDTANYNVVSPNLWRSGLIFAQNLSSPLVPVVRWRTAAAFPGAGTLANYTSFELANIGIGPTDTQFENVVGTYSNGGGVAPFPTTIEDGLNASITTKSQYVRGVTDLAGDENGIAVAIQDLPIGAFPLQLAL